MHVSRSALNDRRKPSADSVLPQAALLVALMLLLLYARLPRQWPDAAAASPAAPDPARHGETAGSSASSPENRGGPAMLAGGVTGGVDTSIGGQTSGAGAGTGTRIPDQS